MDAYVDLRLLPDPEFPPAMLMSALFAKLHRALVARGSGDIGVSFPKLARDGEHLGDCLRLHGVRNALDALMEQGWLTGMRDHVSIAPVGAVPANAGHRIIRRVQARSSPERERRRLVARTGVTPEAALAILPDDRAQRLDLPYVVLHSQSTGQQFRLFIEHLPLREQPLSGRFGTYGLSAGASVPWF